MLFLIVLLKDSISRRTGTANLVQMRLQTSYFCHLLRPSLVHHEVHSPQRCISSRQMIDNIFVIETTALAHVACALQESGILLTDFAAAYPSVNHSWIFSVLENTGLPDSLCRFLRSIFWDIITHVEFAGAERGHFLMARGVRHGCPASGFLFAMAFDPIFRWLQESIIPKNWISCSLHNALTLRTSPLLHPLLES